MESSMIFAALKYKQWADLRTLDAVRALNTVDHPSSLAFARQQLNHMVRVEELFKARLLGEAEPHSTTNTEHVPELPELDRRISESNSWFLSYAEGLPPAQLTEPLGFRFVDGQRGTMTRDEVLFHIVNHGTYHRGAIGHALDLAHAPRPADTYTVFAHAIEPHRREQA
jgi:uncharacterized damage-inducible protein DinB